MIVDPSELEVGKSYTFSQIKNVVRITSGTVTSEIKNDRFVTIQCLDSQKGKIIDLSVVSRIDLLDI